MTTEPKTDSQTVAIYKYLENEIMNGNLVPGDRLDDVAIAKRFGVSKTPVREAVLQLAAVDFVTLKQRVGAIVSPISLHRMVQMFEVMAKYEGTAAALAAERMTNAERTRLSELVKDCSDVAQRDGANAQFEYAEVNFEFHEAIYRGSHNEYLHDLATSLRRRLAPYRRYWLSSTFRRRKSSNEHSNIAQLIIDGDGKGAQLVMEAHLNLQTGLLAELLDRLPAEYLIGVKDDLSKVKAKVQA